MIASRAAAIHPSPLSACDCLQQKQSTSEDTPNEMNEDDSTKLALKLAPVHRAKQSAQQCAVCDKNFGLFRGKHSCRSW